MKKLLIIGFVLILHITNAYTQRAPTYITGYKYWFDGDITNGYTVNLTSTSDIAITDNLQPKNTLNIGFHNVSFMVQQSDNQWSTPVTNNFYYATSGAAASYEYWFDSNYVNKQVVAIADTNNLILTNQMLNATSLINGFHQFNIRFKPNGGLWSNIQSEYVFKRGNDANAIIDVKKIRYWFDTAFSKAKEISTLGQNGIISNSLDGYGLTLGKHYLNYQIMDNANIWSSAMIDSFTYISSINWNGSINSDWLTSGNWTPNNIPGSIDSVFIPPTANQPTITTGVNAVASTLTIQNGGIVTLSGTGTLNASNGITVNPGGALIGNSSNVSGTVTLQQTFVGQRGWRVLANPFTTATTIATVASGNNIAISTTPSGVSGLTDSRTYDNSATPTVTAWANVTASSWAANTAYALFYRGTNAEVTGNSYTSGPAGQTYSVSGTLNGATTTITPLVGDGTSFNLVGNPYAAPVNTQALTGQTTNTPYYTYQISAGGSQSAQRTKAGSWVAASSNSNTTNTIPVLGVVAYQPASASAFNITTSDINTSGTLQTGLFGASTEIKQLELVVNQNGNFQDKLFIRMDNTATNSAKDRVDLMKFYNDVTNFYTINKEEDIRLAVDARKDLTTTTSIPLGISAATGNYTLNVANNNLENITIYLKDKLTNSQTELTAGANYSFSITADAATKGEGRFELMFVNKAIATLPTNNTSGGFTAKVLGNVITNNQPIQVQVQNASANAVIQVKDANGRSIATQAAVNGLNTINVSRASLGLYIVQTTDDNNIITDKVIKQ